VIQIDTDFADIDKLFQEKGQGPHLLELDFFPTTAGGETQQSRCTGGQDTAPWIWQHSITEKLVSRYPTQSGKGWDTGVLSWYLKSLKESKSKTAYDQAQHILALNCKQLLVVLKDIPESCAPARKVMIKQQVSAFLGSSLNETCQTYIYCPCPFIFCFQIVYRYVLLCFVSKQTVQLSASRALMPFGSSNCSNQRMCHPIDWRSCALSGFWTRQYVGSISGLSLTTLFYTELTLCLQTLTFTQTGKGNKLLGVLFPT
jgi:hypothetical protein